MFQIPFLTSSIRSWTSGWHSYIVKTTVYSPQPRNRLALRRGTLASLCNHPELVVRLVSTEVVVNETIGLPSMFNRQSLRANPCHSLEQRGMCARKVFSHLVSCGPCLTFTRGHMVNHWLYWTDRRESGEVLP